MVEERSAIDLLLDENYTGNIVMYDENDKEVEFEQIAIFCNQQLTIGVFVLALKKYIFSLYFWKWIL